MVPNDDGICPMRFVSAVIPTIPARAGMLKRLLESLPPDVERIVMPQSGMSLAKKRNEGAALSSEYFILFIDDDNELAPNVIDELVNRYRAGVGVIGLVACYDDDKEVVADGGSDRGYLSGFQKGRYTNANIRDLPKDLYEVDEVANAFLVPERIFREVGGFDEKRFPIDLDEADLCKRIKDAGYKVMMCPTAITYHNSQTYSWIPDFRRPMNAFFMGRNRILFQQKHSSFLKYILYLLVFFPVFYFSYVAALIYRRKPWMIIHFTKGVWNGLQGRFANKYFE